MLAVLIEEESAIAFLNIIRSQEVDTRKNNCSA